jgi:membrane protein DedA with SNARE-associated domain
MDPLGNLIDWIAAYGVVGLIALGAVERFVPILPSYGVLVAVGIAAAHGAWSVVGAVSATVAGSVIGCMILYSLARAQSERSSYRLVTRFGLVIGMSSVRVDKTMSSFRANQRSIAFGTQLVPTIRLITPVIAGLFRADARTFAIATLAGIVVWNGLFIAVGHAAAAIAPATNASALAFKVLLLLVSAEATLIVSWRWLRRS